MKPFFRACVTNVWATGTAFLTSNLACAEPVIFLSGLGAKCMRVIPSLLLGMGLSAAFYAHSAEFTNTSECVPGKQVTHRNGKSGTIVALRNGSCVVRHEDGSERSYLHWMLSPQGSASASPAADLVPGNYVCSATGAGSFPITIRGGNRYTDRADKSGEFSISAGKEIIFKSGSLAGQYSELLGVGKFGLTSTKGKMFYTVCNLK